MLVVNCHRNKGERRSQENKQCANCWTILKALKPVWEAWRDLKGALWKIFNVRQSLDSFISVKIWVMCLGKKDFLKMLQLF